MKFKTIFCAAIISVLLFSCSSSYYYQLYKAVPIDSSIKQENDVLVFEDNNCRISYNLWESNGNIGFQLYNKTNENIYINLEESFFILNSIAHNYYKNRIITESSNQVISSTSSLGFTTSSPLYRSYWYSPAIVSLGKQSASTAGHSVAMYEEKIVVIPSKTAKIISEYNISGELLKNCNLLKYPSRKEIKAINFGKTDSPLSFNNLISYKVGTSNTIKVENAFYVSEISNYPEKEFFEMRKEQDCDKSKSRKFFKYAAPNTFYILYTNDLGTDTAKY